MKAKDLLDSHPLSKEIIKKWFMKEILKSFENDDVPQEFKDLILSEGVSDEKLTTLIDVNTRMLLDVFDDNDVIMVITYHENSNFGWALNNLVSEIPFLTRKDAEKDCLIQAFEILENNLTNNN